jgi:hypothetical protein
MYETAVCGNSFECLIAGLAVIVIIVIALGLMVQIVPPGEAAKQIAAVAGALVVLVLASRTLQTIWARISRISVAAIVVIGVLILWLKLRAAKDAKK